MNFLFCFWLQISLKLAELEENFTANVNVSSQKILLQVFPSENPKLHQENMSMNKYTPSNPTFIYSKTGVFRGIPIFLIFAPKHRLWVLVRTTSVMRF